jgi:hypothetical protein
VRGYATGDNDAGSIVVDHGYEVSATESAIHLADQKEFRGRSGGKSSDSIQETGRGGFSLPVESLPPTIRRELEQATRELRRAAEAMSLAHGEEGVDVVELANAVQDYRDQLAIFWKHNRYGLQPWQRVLALVQQAISENLKDEEMTLVQCNGLSSIVKYIENRFLAKGDVLEAMRELKRDGFDTFAFFSHVS